MYKNLFLQAQFEFYFSFVKTLYFYVTVVGKDESVPVSTIDMYIDGTQIELRITSRPYLDVSGDLFLLYFIKIIVIYNI